MSQSANNLKAVFTDTANAIRQKAGKVDAISPRDFADEILALPSGGGNRGVKKKTLMSLSSTATNEIVTINDITYNYCVTSAEASSVNSSYCLCLPEKQLSSNTQSCPAIMYADNELVFHYSNAQGLLGWNLDTATTGSVTLLFTDTVTSAYVVNDNGNWVLFYNLV